MVKKRASNEFVCSLTFVVNGNGEILQNATAHRKVIVITLREMNIC